MIAAKVVLDSIAHNGARLTTFELCYPRMIHAELMTHRVFARNAASSRAIPTSKKIAAIKADPAMPSEWGANKAGMQSGGPTSEEVAREAKRLWLDARDGAVLHAGTLSGLYCARCYVERCVCADPRITLDLHKQVANRILEPFDHITVVLSTTKLHNHFKLRLETDADGRPMADPTYFELATKWKQAYDASTPRQLDVEQWHLPYVEADDLPSIERWWWETFSKQPSVGQLLSVAKKVSVGRCARVSHVRQGTGDIGDNVVLHDRLVGPGHWSPFEHQATPLGYEVVDGRDRCDWCEGAPGRVALKRNVIVCNKCAQGHINSGCFHGWQQYRSEFSNEAGGD